MKRYLLTCVLLTAALTVCAQDEGIKLKDLAVPNSPAFILTDITPTLVQTPNTPKKFILGVAQSFGNASSGFPDNYSAEFAPYWFLNGSKQNVYSALGLQTRVNDEGKLIPGYKEDVFSGLKFTSISIAFINKDLIPDGTDQAHKVFAIGLKTTIIKVQQSGSAGKMLNKIKKWHADALADIAKYQDALARDKPQSFVDSLVKAIALRKANDSLDLSKQINDYIQEKPKFSWDVAGAYATYGIGDADWQPGRSGVWTTVSTYLPLASATGGPSKNYFNMNVSARSLWDNYTKNDAGLIVKSSAFDIGGKAGLDFDGFSMGVESLYRHINGKAGNENRTVGVLSYKIADSVYLMGAFGKNFQSQSKSIALFGINWGLGNEKVDISK
ncbi:hypothetical protein [Mucilaginibacter sp. AK015]|uniref:hypothetical protein n=1 Tax=Mucilaginibacter sp. AK015 TaxID=2723072 RepID=UPI00161778EE|nr:hypothetical protein [Mucilaginibacter sp. AK015]MBB5395475.1 hypothetical protein [Mucilaginibacter sp. AK015]